MTTTDTGTALWPITISPSDHPATPAERDAILADPGFGRSFTDHLVRATWTAAEGWHDAAPRGRTARSSSTRPRTSCTTARRSSRGSRPTGTPTAPSGRSGPMQNAERFANSARRLAMAELPAELFLGSIEALVRQDRDWVPSGQEKSLYLRPFMIATEIGLGVRPADRYEYLLIASPAGAYFPRGLKPVSVWLSDDYVRAAPGGTGEAKCARQLRRLPGRPGRGRPARLRPGGVARCGRAPLDRGDGRHEPVLRARARRLGPPRHPRADRLAAARHHPLVAAARWPADLGIRAEEGRISVDEWREGCASGEITEVFACGTAAVITPVGEVKSRTSGSWSVGEGGTGPVTDAAASGSARHPDRCGARHAQLAAHDLLTRHTGVRGLAPGFGRLGACADHTRPHARRSRAASPWLGL